jgi:hypothetical protein
MTPWPWTVPFQIQLINILRFEVHITYVALFSDWTLSLLSKMLDFADTAFKGICLLILDGQKRLAQRIYGLSALRPRSLSNGWTRPPVYHSTSQDIHCWPVEASASLQWVMLRWFTSFIRSCKHLASEHRRRRRVRDVNALKKNPFEADDEDEETTVDGECAA